MAPQNKTRIYKDDCISKKNPRELGSISMKKLSSSDLVDGTKLITKIMSMSTSNGGSSRISASVDFNTMKLDDKNVARVLPGMITDLQFFPTKDTKMLVAGSKLGNLSFWNIDSDEDDDNCIFMYQPHPAYISGISIHPSSLSKVVSSCYDGFIRLLDIEKESFDLIHRSQQKIDSICRQYDNMHCLYFGEGGNGSAGLLDLRSSSKPSMTWSLHKSSIYTIDFSSQNHNLMATGSKDETACIWDLRKLDQINDNPTIPLKLIEHEAAVNSAYFSPSGNFLATTSKDNIIGLVSSIDYEDECKIHHYNYTSRFFATFRGIWGWDDNFIIVGNKKKKGIDIISVLEEEEEKKVSLKVSLTLEDDGKVSAIPCRINAHPLIPGTLAASTNGGQVYIWDL
ncbi:uncharacterized protein [Rutidosis leptorrhynchoides]|uniref:uncharacterized protein n=1 Tax=Rutidosis leptorrhynchoides TaxID=125765 RepID=UPI003A994249